MRSHPVWVRGLKHSSVYYDVLVSKSHPVWVRGLKLKMQLNHFLLFLVAPRVGAWIETYMSGSACISPLCRTPCGCVD